MTVDICINLVSRRHGCEDMKGTALRVDANLLALLIQYGDGSQFGVWLRRYKQSWRLQEMRHQVLRSVRQLHEVVAEAVGGVLAMRVMDAFSQRVALWSGWLGSWTVTCSSLRLGQSQMFDEPPPLL